MGGVYALPFVCLALPGPHSPGVPVPRTRHTPVRMHNPATFVVSMRNTHMPLLCRGERGGRWRKPSMMFARRAWPKLAHNPTNPYPTHTHPTHTHKPQLFAAFPHHHAPPSSSSCLPLAATIRSPAAPTTPTLPPWRP